MPYESVPWLHTNEAINCSQCNTGDGVQHRVLVTEDTGNMENPTGAEMAKEDLGQMMFTF